MDKYLTSIEDELDRNWVGPGGDTAGSSLSTSSCLVSDGSAVVPGPSAAVSLDGERSEQFDDEEFLNSIEVELDRLIARIRHEPDGSAASDSDFSLGRGPVSSSDLGFSDRASKERKA